MNEMAVVEWLSQPVADPDIKAEQAARLRQIQLTKPPGSLGRLEDIAIRLAALQSTTKPNIDHVQIAIFAGDHGVAAEGVSAFPQSVTSEMIKNFANGGAAICVLARSIKAQLDLINLGTAYDTGLLDNVRSHSLGPGTANFTQAPAMTDSQLDHSLYAGYQAVERAQSTDMQLFIGGEMGIANSTAAAALACTLLNASPAKLTGPGTGLDTDGVTHKLGVIQRAIDLHTPHITSPREALRRMGGFEIAALAGAYIRCAQVGMPAIVDGFISSVAALAAEQLHPGIKTWLLFSHTSTEPGHRHVLEALSARPLLDLQLRLGEGSGAVLIVPILRLACSLHNEMATFSEAAVSNKLT
ncbi:MAG: nicotinate-nucleotide--dimethylbenzimidazole phosphoribosyltransferase [Nitrosomonas sp.]|nr:nicotinate-nucleotide--dimethylbenzimidazole phosphoribosyltransferase [Nitrosomonas sp.]MDP1950228.1 nicotinate-nucleotide--dimethylbenzimidazole phosphoribosyltransferase [Nitrosomonas sp.]